MLDVPVVEQAAWQDARVGVKVGAPQRVLNGDFPDTRSAEVELGDSSAERLARRSLSLWSKRSKLLRKRSIVSPSSAATLDAYRVPGRLELDEIPDVVDTLRRIRIPVEVLLRLPRLHPLHRISSTKRELLSLIGANNC
jgi:hypothetical protein